MNTRNHRFDTPLGRMAHAASLNGTSPQDIVDLRNKIAGHLDRLAPLRPRTTAEPVPSTPDKGFAGILGGETRLQDSPEAYEAYEDEAPYSYDSSPDEPWRAEQQDHNGTGIPLLTSYEEPDRPSILSTEAASATQSAFNKLAENLMSRAMGERSVEDVARELLRTMLKSWLDEHLPSLVERLVREEIERVARRGSMR